MFECNGKQYELKMNIARVKLVEGATKTPLMAEWQNNNGCLSLNTIEVCFQLCLKEAGADAYCPQKEGAVVCQEYMEKHGYMMAALRVQEALQADMPFLFLAN